LQSCICVSDCFNELNDDDDDDDDDDELLAVAFIIH